MRSVQCSRPSPFEMYDLFSAVGQRDSSSSVLLDSDCMICSFVLGNSDLMATVYLVQDTLAI